MSLQTFGADPHGVQVEWRDGGGCTHLLGVTELGRMLGNDPNIALLVLHGLGRWEALWSRGGRDPQRRGWLRVGEEGGESSSSRRSSSSSIDSGEEQTTTTVAESHGLKRRANRTTKPYPPWIHI